MNIVNLSTGAIVILSVAATRAMSEGKRFRLSFLAAEGNLPAGVRYKVGEGVWSPPFYDESENDPYRDFTYTATHVSVHDGSDAMLVSSDEDTITLVNEEGFKWTDRIREWCPIGS